MSPPTWLRPEPGVTLVTLRATSIAVAMLSIGIRPRVSLSCTFHVPAAGAVLNVHVIWVYEATIVAESHLELASETLATSVGRPVPMMVKSFAESAWLVIIALDST